MDIGKIREALSVLAENRPDYSERLRVCGFTCSHINDEWFADNCTAEMRAIHARYAVEFAREAIGSGKPSEIVHTDDANCRSEWLNQLKLGRLREYGPVEALRKSPQTRWLAQLSPCLRELMRVADGAGRWEREQQNHRAKIFVERWSEELSQHREDIVGCARSSSEPTSEVSMRLHFAQHLQHELSCLGGRTLRGMYMGKEIYVVGFSIRDTLMLVVQPVVVGDDINNPFDRGSAGLGFRVVELSGASPLQLGSAPVLHLGELLPSEFANYGRYHGIRDFCLVVIAWTAALKIVLPDAIECLKAM